MNKVSDIIMWVYGGLILFALGVVVFSSIKGPVILDCWKGCGQ